MNSLYRAEYPRPQLRRLEWESLNGVWSLCFDENDEGVHDRWYEDGPFNQSIVVPFSYQSPLSGVTTDKSYDIVWYRRTFSISSSMLERKLHLHFGAVDYEASVWVNGQHVAEHKGGYTPFTVDISNVVLEGDNVVVVRVHDSASMEQPRGKQHWKSNPDGIFYTRTTGIWQSVWIEATGHSYIDALRFTPDVDSGQIQIEIDNVLSRGGSLQNFSVEVEISFRDNLVAKDLCQLTDTRIIRSVDLNSHDVNGAGRLWSPEHPDLYEVVIRLTTADEIVDEVFSYFGMRKISVESGKVFLNNYPYYMKLVLNQGYYPGGGITAPAEEQMKEDIQLIKDMGFNGVRTHQKVEDPVFLYWCDRLGLLVWGEMPSTYRFSSKAISNTVEEWKEVVKRDYNHPSIVAWVPVNESWGVPHVLLEESEQAATLALFYLTKAYDSTRLVISNDGWEHTVSDICTVHDYEWNPDRLVERYSSVESMLQGLPGFKNVYARGYHYNGEPIIVSECGGISFIEETDEGWGYSSARDAEDFIRRYSDVVTPLLSSTMIQGFCFTQFTDIESEKNGLVKFNREPKVPVDTVFKINNGIPVHHD